MRCSAWLLSLTAPHGFSDGRRLAPRREVKVFWKRFTILKTRRVFPLEDSAALLGLLFAFLGIFQGRQLGLPYLDGAASIVIGLLLFVVAVLMVYESKGLLIGEGLDRETLNSARALVAADPAVERVQHLHTLYLGAHEVLLAIELRFRSTISALEVRESVTRLKQEIQAQHPDVTRIFFGAESISGDDPD